MTVGDMRDRMSQGEYVQWQAYYGLKAQKEELQMKKSKRR